MYDMGPMVIVGVVAAAYLMEALSDRKPSLPLPASCTVLLSLCSPSPKAMRAQTQDSSSSVTSVRQRIAIRHVAFVLANCR